MRWMRDAMNAQIHEQKAAATIGIQNDIRRSVSASIGLRPPRPRLCRIVSMVEVV
jgi:hypothetical protein